MKKILSILASLTIFASTTVTVISCTTNGSNPYHNNPNYNPNNSNQTEETKKAIEQAMEARIKAAILTDNYHINKQQTQDVAFRHISNTEQNLKTTYNTFFDESSLDHVTTKEIDLNGNLGFEGGMINPILNQVNLSDFFKEIIKNITNIDLNSQDLKTQIVQIFTTIRDILQGFSASAIADKLPILITKIPSGIMDMIPKIIGNTLSDVTQSFVNTFANRSVVETILNGLVQGSDLSRFANSTVATLFDAFFVNLTNLVGFAIDEKYTAIDDTATVNFDQLGEYWYNNRKKLSEFSFTKNLPGTVEKLISTLAIFNALLTIYKTPTILPTDDQHLFDNQTTNDEFVANMQTKTLASFEFDLTKFHLGQLISNSVYYLGQTNLVGQQRFQKLLYITLFNGDLSSDDSKIPSFWKFAFSLITANSKSSDATISPEIAKKMNPLYHETLAPKFLQPILNNHAINITEINTEDKNKTLWSIINGTDGSPATPGLKNLIDSLYRVLGEKPMNGIYHGDLREIIDSFATLTEQMSIEDIKAKIDKLIGVNNPLNVITLLNAKLSDILALANVEGYVENDLGLIPDYPGYYTTRSLKELVNDLGQTFKMNGNESIADLTYYYLDFTVVKNMLISLLYDNGINENKGLLADAIDALVKNEPLPPVLGYNPTNFDEIKRTSFLGQLLTFFVPELSPLDSEYINWKTDLTGKQDNFNWIIDGVLSILINTTKPVDYTDFIKKVLEIDRAFEIKILSKKLSKNGNIKSIEYIIIYDLSAVETALGYPNKDIKTKTYHLSFNRNNEVDTYKFIKFDKN